MMWLDFAIASKQDAERAFFDFDDIEAVDEIARLQLTDLSDFEMAHLGMLLCGGYDPELVLDGDDPDEIITACDPKLVRALAALHDDQLAKLASRWHENSGIKDADANLRALQRFAVKAASQGLPLLYAQGSDQPEAPED